MLQRSIFIVIEKVIRKSLELEFRLEGEYYDWTSLLLLS